jgi:hypothetical protein
MTDIHAELTAAKINDRVQELIYMLDLIDPIFATSVLTTALVHFLETQKDPGVSRSVVDAVSSRRCDTPTQPFV